MTTGLGVVRAAAGPGRIGVDAVSQEVERGLTGRETTQVRILAQVTETLAVCRLLLKIGMEVIAADSEEVARSDKFRPAREFARAPTRGSRWWFAVLTDEVRLGLALTGRLSWSRGGNLRAEVIDLQGVDAAHLHICGVSIIAPLEDGTRPVAAVPEPECRIVWASV